MLAAVSVVEAWQIATSFRQPGRAESFAQSAGAQSTAEKGGIAADESAEQIDWIEVRPDVAAFDRSLQPGVRFFVHPGVVACSEQNRQI
jgi:hypothetical protein